MHVVPHSEIEVIDVDEEENSTPDRAQKRDAVSAGLSKSSVSKKIQKTNKSKLWGTTTAAAVQLSKESGHQTKTTILGDCCFFDN